MTWSDYEKALLALLIWREARGEIRSAKIAVAYSVLSRAEHPTWWGDSIASCIAKKWQYSSMTAPGDPNLIKYPIQPDPAFNDCLAVADDVLNGRIENPAPGADSYFDHSIEAPPWAVSNQSGFVVVLGKLSFYHTGNWKASVTVVETAPVVLSVSPQAVHVSCRQGTNPAPVTVGVSSSDGSAIGWSVQSASSVFTIRVSPSSGQTNSGFLLEIDASALVPGNYSDNISVSSPDSQNKAVNIPVFLMVSA